MQCFQLVLRIRLKLVKEVIQKVHLLKVTAFEDQKTL